MCFSLAESAREREPFKAFVTMYEQVGMITSSINTKTNTNIPGGKQVDSYDGGSARKAPGIGALASRGGSRKCDDRVQDQQSVRNMSGVSLSMQPSSID